MDRAVKHSVDTNSKQLRQINLGRQLFVDTFLLNDTLTRGVKVLFHNASYRDDVNPVLKPDKVWEG
jgi:hypothetical protein